MASSPKLLGKREREDGSETEPILKKHKEPSDDKETEEGFAETLQQTESDHESLAPANETKEFADTLQQTRATLIPVKRDTVEGLDHFLEETEEFADTLQQTRATLIPVKRDTVEGLDHFLEETEEGFADTLQQTRATLIPVKRDTVEGLDHFPEAVFAREKTLFVFYLHPFTGMLNLINLFKDVEEVVSVQLTVNNKNQYMPSCFVEFASAAKAKKAQEKKDGRYVHRQKVTVGMVAETGPYPPRPNNEHYILQKHSVIDEDEAVEGLDAAAAREKMLFIANLSPQTKMKHIIDFFKDVGHVVSVRLIVNHEDKHVGYGFAEFVSAYGAKEVLEKKNGEYLHDHKIFLSVAKTAPFPLRPKFNLVEKLCYEDYLLRESLLIEEDEAVEGQTPDFVEVDAIRKRTLFIWHLYFRIKTSDIINFFKGVGQVVHVRLLVTKKGQHLCRGYVQFASADEAKKALEKKDGECMYGQRVYLNMSNEDTYPRPCMSVDFPWFCIDHKVWYEDYLRQEGRLIDEDEAVEGPDKTPDYVEEVAVRKKTLFIANLYLKTKISYIIDFFKDIGEVVSVRLAVNNHGRRVGCGFVEFATTNEAKKAWEKKKGKQLNNNFIYLAFAEMAPYPLRPKYKLAEKLWCERESLSMEKDDLETKPEVKKLMDLHCGKKITFPDDPEDN